MNPASDILKNFNLYIDGNGYAGNVDEVTLPKLNVKTEDYQAGGLDVPIGIDMGMEKMEATFVLSKHDYDALSKWGIGDGETIPLVFKGAAESQDGSVKAIRVEMTGKVRSVEIGTIKAGEHATTTYTMEVTYYKHTIDGKVVHEIDVINMVRIINGADRLASVRAAIK